MRERRFVATRLSLKTEPGRSLLRIADRWGRTRIGLRLAARAPGIVVFDGNGVAIKGNSP